MKLTRREHVIPRMLLSQFVAIDGRLRVYEKGKLPRASKPENECAENDYFEFELRGKKTNNRYENWLSQIESNAASAIAGIMQRSKITRQEDAEIWATFVASLFGRTRKVRTQISEAMTQKFRQQTGNPGYIRDLHLALLKQQGELHFTEDVQRAVTMIHATMDASPSYFFVSGLPNRIRIIAESLLTRDWHTIDAPTGYSFLISDCPVVTYEVRDGKLFPGTGFGNEKTIALLSVSPKHLFVASPRRGEWPTVFSSADMKYVNRLIVQFAHRNVYANVESEEVQKLVDAEIDTIKFGMNAFVPPVR